MKKKFNDVALKTRLYAEKATIMSYIYNDTEVTVTQGEKVISHEKHDAASFRAAILGALNNAKIPYALIMAEENITTFAVARDRRAEAEVAIDAVPGVRLALAASGSWESYNATSAIANALLKPFSAVRREVARDLKRLGA